MQVELSRQLEYLTSDWLADRPRHVPAFFRAALRAFEAAARDGARLQNGERYPAARSALHADRPADVSADEWEDLFSFVLVKLCHFVGSGRALRFVRDLCHPSRFERLTLS